MTSGSASSASSTDGDTTPSLPSICPACGASLLGALATASDPTPARDQEPITGQYRELDDDSATRPAPIDQLPTRPTPPETAAQAAQAEEDAGSTRDLPASALPTPPPSPGAGLRRAGRVIGALALVVILLAVVALAALAINGDLPFGQQAATPTATPSATLAPTATPAAITYTRAGLYQIIYPTGWLTTEQNTPPSSYQTSFINARGGATVSITAQQTAELLDPATVDTNYLNGLAAPTGTKATNLSSPQAITLAGQTWTEESADVTLLTGSGTQYAHAVALSINHGGYLYTIVRLVPVASSGDAASAFSVADQANFQPMLASFKFLG